VDFPHLFYRYSRYLKNAYGRPAYRVAVDAGFSCPNRGPERRNPGCTYCDEYGARAVYLERDHLGTVDREIIRRQVEGGIEFLTKRYNAEIFLLYLQAFSSTYAPVEVLESVFDYCLSLHDFRELIVSTRPDCLTEEKADLLASYRKRDMDVWVELGLQSAHDTTLRRIRRGHTAADFFEAAELLEERGIKQMTHLVFGLPGESRREILETVRRVAELRPEGVKIHNLHIPVGAPMFRQYLGGELSVPSAPRHLAYTVEALELLPPDTVIGRLTCDTPRHRRGAPKNFWKKPRFYREVENEMRRRGTRQGRLWSDTAPEDAARDDSATEDSAADRDGSMS
jgi:hypothetical protein